MTITREMSCVDCTFIADDGCLPTTEDVARLLAEKFPHCDRFEGRTFRIGHAKAGYFIEEMRDN